MLVEMLNENNVEFVHVEESDYDSRFLRCVELVKEMMGEQGQALTALSLWERAGVRESVHSELNHHFPTHMPVQHLAVRLGNVFHAQPAQRFTQ